MFRCHNIQCICILKPTNKFIYIQGPLPLDSSLLGERAMKCRAYAKALHYKEDEFHRGPKTQILESLIRSD